LFVAVTYGDTWISSDNGLTWTKYSGSFTSGTGVVYSPTQEKFVTCNTNRSHSILTAADGHSWVEVGVADLEGMGICYTQGLVVVVGELSSGAKSSASSSDLVTWVSKTMPLVFVSSVCPCAGGVIAGSDNGNNEVSINPLVYP
jgi:hypothetical protein